MAEKFPKEIYLQGNLRLDQETTKRKDARFHDKIYKDPGPTQRPNNSIPLTEFIQEKIDNEEIIIPEQDCDCKENPITTCDYVVEGIDLGGESTCDYIIPNANLTIYRNWIEIEFIEEFVYEGTWDENGYGNFYLQLNEGSGNDTYILYGNEIDSLSSFDNGFYTLKLKDVVDYFYSQYLISSNPTLPTMVIDNNKMLFTYTRFYSFPVFKINIENKSTNKTPNDLKDIFTYTTNSTNVQYSTDNSNYLMFNWSWQTTTYYVLYVNINGEWVLIDSEEIVDGVWRRNNSTDIITTYELRNTTNYNPDFTGDVDSICEGGNSKSFEVNINGEWIDKTNEVTEQGIWELLNTTDEVTAWRYVDSEEEGEPTPIVGDCTTTEPDTYNICEKINNHEERIIILENSSSSLEFENGLKTLPGYNASETQTLKNVAGTISWITD